MVFSKIKHTIIRKYLTNAVVFPPLQNEVGEDVKYLRGKILNAGSGSRRNIDAWVDGEVINQDIFSHPSIDIVSPLDTIPVENNSFDSAFCNAVLEHVSNPIIVINEISRVLKSDGYLYLCVPFMQPEHLCPTDFQRYTMDGLKKVLNDAGFRIIKADGAGLNVYHSLAWIVQEWLNSKKTFKYYIMRMILYPILQKKCKNSTNYVHSISSAYRIIAQKK